MRAKEIQKVCQIVKRHINNVTFFDIVSEIGTPDYCVRRALERLRQMDEQSVLDAIAVLFIAVHKNESIRTEDQKTP
jgi:hypothetical protein